VPDTSKGEVLVLLTTFGLTADAVREKLLGAGLPSLWVPKIIRHVEKIPVLGSGKLDLKAAAISRWRPAGSERKAARADRLPRPRRRQRHRWHGLLVRPRGVTKFGAPFLLRSVGLPAAALRGDLDRLYAERVLAFVRESSVDAAVILAQDEPYRDDGTKIEGAGGFYVPNDFVLRLAREHREFLPAISIHPRAAMPLDELERGLAAGAVMLKCLPNCQNIDWNDRRYTRFLERMAGSGLVCSRTPAANGRSRPRAAARRSAGAHPRA